MTGRLQAAKARRAACLLAASVATVAQTPLWPHGDGSARKFVISISVFSRTDVHSPTTCDDGSSAVPSHSRCYLTPYYTSLINVIINWRWLLPEWTVRVHTSKGHPFASQLRRVGAEVKEHDFDPDTWASAMLWRFLVEDDMSVDAFASREAEATPTFADAAVLRHWLRTGLPLHAIAAAPPHVTFNGGTWGARRGFITSALNSSMADAIAAYSLIAEREDGVAFGSQYGDDQRFMAAVLWNALMPRTNGIAYRASAVHHPWCLFRHCIRFPLSPDTTNDFIPSMNEQSPNELILCHHSETPRCRRHEWTSGEQAWLGLYELCTGMEFFSGEPLGVNRSRLGMPTCPYEGITSDSVWEASGVLQDTAWQWPPDPDSATARGIAPVDTSGDARLREHDVQRLCARMAPAGIAAATSGVDGVGSNSANGLDGWDCGIV